MKFLLSILIYSFISLRSTAQTTDTLEDHNSFKTIFAHSNPSLKYSFNRETYTHNYSGNWDFDGDKKMDSLYFIGDNALHWFHLRIILSCDKKVRDYDWIFSEFPILQSFEQLKLSAKGSQPFMGFVISDFNHEGKMAICVHLNTKVNPTPEAWKTKGVSANDILIEYKNKELVVRNFLRLRKE